MIEAMGSLFLLLDRFRDEGSEMSHKFKIWDDFLLKDIAPFKVFIASTRDPNWKEYQELRQSFFLYWQVCVL